MALTFIIPPEAPTWVILGITFLAALSLATLVCAYEAIRRPDWW